MILTGGIDLSVGAVLALVVVLTGGLLPQIGILPTVLVALLVGTTMGAINGLGITKGNVQPFVMTLGMTGIARGLAYITPWNANSCSRQAVPISRQRIPVKPPCRR